MKQKRTIYDPVEIVDIGHKGMSIGRCEDGRVILVERVVPGDVVAAERTRKRKGMVNARPVRIHKYSSHRTEPFCAHFGVCGGCKWQNMDYTAQLSFKENAVRESLRRISGLQQPEVLPILGAPDIRRYRNKLQFSFTDQRWLTEEEIDSGKTFEQRDGLGFHVAGAFAHVVDIGTCHLMDEPVNAIRNFIRDLAIQRELEFQNIRTHEGLLRTLTIRSNRKGEYMLILTCYDSDREEVFGLLDAVMEEFPQVVSTYYCINTKLNDSDLDLPMLHYKGEVYLGEALGDVLYRIGPKSFFQTNPAQAEHLFAHAIDFAGLKGDENVYDLYTGIGSIALAVASQCRHVVGIEEIHEAIVDAEMNAGINGIENVDFVCGDVRHVLTPEFLSRYGKADVVITDPPRAGMHADAIGFLLEANPSRIVYISCNPSTQARDIGMLSEGFRFVKAQPVDMFPHTSHIENIVLLENRNNG